MQSRQLLNLLRGYVNKRIRLSFSDGEVLVADLDLVLDDEDAVVFDLVASNKPDKYEKSDKAPHIFAKIGDIVHCELAER